MSYHFLCDRRTRLIIPGNEELRNIKNIYIIIFGVLKVPRLIQKYEKGNKSVLLLDVGGA